MDDEEFKKLLKDVVGMFRDMEASPECPPDDMLLDYVYNKLSEAENDKVRKHKDHCDRIVSCQVFSRSFAANSATEERRW